MSSAPTVTDTAWFVSHPQRFVDTGTAKMAYRKIGSGPPLLMIHGWPFSNLTYRKLARLLAPSFTCYLPDTPGLGETQWGPRTSFSFGAQAESMKAFARGLALDEYAVLAHDTGASIARQLALIDPRVRKLVLLDTEIPGHRPPWIPLYQRLVSAPGSDVAFSLLMRIPAFRRSSMGYGGCFYDPSLLNEDFLDCFVRPLLESRERMRGVNNYLRGIDWEMVDGFARRHAEIRVPVLLVWGADDPVFPVERARPMVAQFGAGAAMREIAHARLLVHEERAGDVAAAALPFLAA